MFEDVKGIIAETLGCTEENVEMDTNLFDDLGADSLDAVELSLAIEEKLGIAIDQDAMISIRTVKDIMDYLENHKE
ncbi:MAG: acyl carrier protein [Lachnospiraceae bacterium]|nr:acyl carrier protein [Lachnospiraceae bacterium]